MAAPMTDTQQAAAVPTPRNAVEWLTTDKAAGAIVLGALAYLVVLRMTFKGSVI